MSEKKAKQPRSGHAEEAAAPAAKRAQKTQNKNDGEKEILDLATKFGYHDSDRLEVAWKVNGEELHWWGATLLPWEEDDIVDECVAVRQLQYDPYPEAGFTETTVEPVVFIGEDVLAHPETHDELFFRREGEGANDEEEEEEADVTIDPKQLVEYTLEKALEKHSALFKQLPASQQSKIAEEVAKRREQLVAQLEAATSEGAVVSKDRMQQILLNLANGEK